MVSHLYQQDVLAVKDLSSPQIQQILDMSKKIKAKSHPKLIQDKIIAHCFFEPSTRTRLSFETAAIRLGGQIMGFSGDEGLSLRKGETLYDTMKVISDYADLIVIRHPVEGAARLTADISEKPVINAGDGANQHPTQALVDLFTIQECQGKLDGLSIALVGDLKYGRTIHSFAEACLLFNVRLYLVSPEVLSLPETICDVLKKQGIRFSFHQSVEEIISKVDVLYLTRIQEERFGEAEYQLIKEHFILTPALLKNAKENLKVLHPLPRVNEIEVGVDRTPFAHYFQQAANAVYVRQALLSLLLNETLT